MRTVRFKNTTGSADTWVSHTIQAGEYYEIQDARELMDWQGDSKVFTDVGSGDLQVGSDVAWFTDKNYAWNTWVLGDVTPPRTADGDHHFVQENFAHITGNKGINWTVHKYLEPGVSYSETMILPDGFTATLNLIDGGSSTAPTSVSLSYFVETATDSGVYMKYNPWIRCNECGVVKLVGTYSVDDTTFTVTDIMTDGLLDLETDLYYEFENTTGEYFFEKITAKNTTNNTVTIANGAPIVLTNNAMVTLKDRCIGKINTQFAYGSKTWISPPNAFVGNGKNYFKLTITNNHTTDSACVSSSLNGWMTPTIGGDN